MAGKKVACVGLRDGDVADFISTHTRMEERVPCGEETSMVRLFCERMRNAVMIVVVSVMWYHVFKFGLMHWWELVKFFVVELIKALVCFP